MTRFAEGRKLLKARFMELREQPSDYRLGVPQPPLEKPHPADALLVDLPDPRAAFLRQLTCSLCWNPEKPEGVLARSAAPRTDLGATLGHAGVQASSGTASRR